MSVELFDYAVLIQKPNAKMPDDDSVRFIGWLASRSFGEQEYAAAVCDNPGCTVSW